jgi:hypothetical protein
MDYATCYAVSLPLTLSAGAVEYWYPLPPLSVRH